MALLESKNISITRGTAPPLFLPDFALEKGEQILLLGPSGSGKTSLMSAISGLLKPSGGTVYFNGQDLYALGSAKIDRLRGEKFGLIFQTLHLLPTLSIRQNIELTANLSRTKIKKSRIEETIKSLGLVDKADRKPDALSQGEQQRAAIGRAILHAPSIILADEPTSALDDENTSIVIDLMINAAKDIGASLVIATHDSRLHDRFSKIITLDTKKAAV